MPIKYDENGAVKRPNKEIKYTKEMIEKYANSAKSVIYFAENFYYIIHPTKGKMKIKLFDYQKQMLENFQNHQHNVLCCGRQLGKCLNNQQLVEILNTETGEIEKIEIGNLFNLLL